MSEQQILLSVGSSARLPVAGLAPEAPGDSVFVVGRDPCRPSAGMARLTFAGVTNLTEGFGWDAYQALHGERANLLFARDGQGWVHVASPDNPLQPQPGWILVALIEPAAQP